MQIMNLYINQHKCLNKFHVNFNIIDGGSSTILIGENGAGKSTLIEVLLQILMTFDSDYIERQIDFEYEIEYLYAGQYIKLIKSQHYYELIIDNDYILTGRIRSIKHGLKKMNLSIFPERIISFYSGSNDKIWPQIKKVNYQYVSLCKKSIYEYMNYLQKPLDCIIPNFPRRKYNYCDEKLTPIFLCSILGGQNSFEKKYLMDSANFLAIENIDFELDFKNVDFNTPLINNEKITDEFLSIIEFIDNRFVDVISNSFMNTYKSKAYFRISGLERMGIDRIAIYDFFEKLQSLFKANYEVFVTYGQSRVKCSEMSEGQRQLIKILGMLGVCSNEDCLVLMDEPDAHMNPKWKYELKSVIDSTLKNAVNTQAIIATHDPLVINGVDHSFIRIFECKSIEGRSRTKVYEPSENTLGMGIDGLLQSEYYGLKNSYDKKTSDIFQRRQGLYIKLINNEISAEEKIELRELTAQLGTMPVSFNTIDFLYDDFIRIFRESNYYTKEYLNFDEIQDRKKTIKKVISKLYEERI